MMVGVDSDVLDEFRRLERRHRDLRDRANRGRAELSKQKDRVTTTEIRLKRVYDEEAGAADDLLRFKLNHGIS